MSKAVISSVAPTMEGGNGNGNSCKKSDKENNRPFEGAPSSTRRTSSTQNLHQQGVVVDPAGSGNGNISGPVNPNHTHTRKSEHTGGFKIGSFTKSLLAQAQLQSNMGVNPGMIQNLLNPTRSQLGLPSISLMPKKEGEGSDEGSPQKEDVTQERNNTLLAPLQVQKIHAEALESRDQSTELPKFHNHTQRYKPVTTSETVRVRSASMGTVEGSVEVAAVIPTPQSKIPGGGSNTEKTRKTISTPKPNTPGPLLKQKSLPTVREKKPSTGSWKFSSEHVRGKEYLIIKPLGKGGCGEVLLVIEKETRELFALKRVNLSGISESSVDECLNEIEMLYELRDSELVVHIYAWEYDKPEKTVKILMEPGQCDLQHSVRSTSWTALKLRSVWERLLTIVDAIHKRGIVHADLKPANFIWSGDNLKIIDFGIASKLQQDHTSIEMLCPKGTLNYISPETIQPESLGPAKIRTKSDIWSLGCILFLMVYGRTPFENIHHPAQKMAAIVKGAIEYPPVPSLYSSIGPEILSVLRLCFQIDHRKRPSTRELLLHPLVMTV